MARYIILLNWTEQGARAANQTVSRAAAARQLFEKGGAKVREVLWTLGQYDGVLSLDAPSDEAITALALQLGTQGNVRTNVLRAFDEKEMEQILKKV